jgi:hypothetical protein
VAVFLRGPGAVPAGSEDSPSPNVRRRVEVTTTPPAGSTPPPSALESRQISIESDATSSNTSEVGSGSSLSVSETSTVATSPSPPGSNSGSHRPNGFTQRASDPFGYLNDKTTTAPVASAMPAAYAPSSMLRNWSSTTGTLFGYQNLPPGQMALAEPIHPHAFVTFGAGMRQKEIDTYTAQHKLAARYTNGNGEGIPYHVPL